MTTRSHSAGRVHTVLETHAQHAREAQDATNQRIEAILRTFQGQVASLQVEVGQLKTSLATQESQHQREVAVLTSQVVDLQRQLAVREGVHGAKERAFQGQFKEIYTAAKAASTRAQEDVTQCHPEANNPGLRIRYHLQRIAEIDAHLNKILALSEVS